MNSNPLRTLVLIAACLGGCAHALPPSAFEDGAPEMRPEDFFAGATTSGGILANRAGSPTQRFSVNGSGLALPDGSFRLDQAVTFDHAAPEMRTWVMRRLDSHHYKATLTNASGAVEGETYGNLFHVLYPIKTPFGGQMEQWLYLQSDGRTVMNEATVRLFGVVVAHLSERITHEGKASSLRGRADGPRPGSRDATLPCPRSSDGEVGS